jgi:hypothetical protein
MNWEGMRGGLFGESLEEWMGEGGEGAMSIIPNDLSIV